MTFEPAKARLTIHTITPTRAEISHWMISIEKPEGVVIQELKIVPTSKDYSTPEIFLREFVDSFNRRYDVEKLEKELRERLQSLTPTDTVSYSIQLSKGDLQVSKVDKTIQSQGGQARASKLSPEKRREISRKAAKARWGSATKRNKK